MVARGQSRHTHLAPRMWHTAKWPTDAGQMWRNREKQTLIIMKHLTYPPGTYMIPFLNKIGWGSTQE